MGISVLQITHQIFFIFRNSFLVLRDSCKSDNIWACAAGRDPSGRANIFVTAKFIHCWNRSSIFHHKMCLKKTIPFCMCGNKTKGVSIALLIRYYLFLQLKEPHSASSIRIYIHFPFSRVGYNNTIHPLLLPHPITTSPSPQNPTLTPHVWRTSCRPPRKG